MVGGWGLVRPSGHFALGYFGQRRFGLGAAEMANGEGGPSQGYIHVKRKQGSFYISHSR